MSRVVSKVKMKVETFSILTILFIAFYLFASTAPLSKYKSIAQDPKTGVHSLRVGKFALVDTFATLMAAMFLGVKFREDPVVIFCILLLFSVPIHMLFGVDTALIKLFNHEV